jgi:hypothetical protein
VLVPRHVGEVFLARLVVNQADDECPHDRIPRCLTRLVMEDLRFRPASLGSKNGFVPSGNPLSRPPVSHAGEPCGRRDCPAHIAACRTGLISGLPRLGKRPSVRHRRDRETSGVARASCREPGGFFPAERGERPAVSLALAGYPRHRDYSPASLLFRGVVLSEKPPPVERGRL